MKILTVISIGLLASVSQLVGAHPGHGAPHGHEVLHPFLGGEHVLILAAIGLVAWALRSKINVRGDRNEEE